MRSLLADMGESVTIELHQDSTAAKGVASRLGIGKIKHLEVGWFWLQDAVRKGDLVLKKICGKINPADVLTKPKSIAEMIRLTDALWFEIRIRKQRPGDIDRDGGFTGFVKRLMRGAEDGGGDREDTMMWWEWNLRSRWEDGRLTG